MSSSWCTTFLPGKRGFPSRISAKMQPMDQMSMAVEYFAKKDPQSSGARYLRSTASYQPSAGSLEISEHTATGFRGN